LRNRDAERLSRLDFPFTCTTFVFTREREEVTMSEVLVEASVRQNRLYLCLRGYMRDEEAAVAADRVLDEVRKLKTGFDVITDMSEFKPASAAGAEQFVRVQKTYKDRGVGRVIRIVGGNVLGKMQAARTTSEAGGLAVEYASSRAEAERMLDAAA
jgi:hypothetical protein